MHKLVLRKFCKFAYPHQGFGYCCNHPKNDWDGLCSPEACERCQVLRLLFFGTGEIAFQQYLKTTKKDGN